MANSLLVGLQLVVAVIWGDCLESSFGKGKVVYVVDWERLLVFLFLCAGAFLALSWSCVLRGSFVFYLSEGLTHIRIWYSGLAGRACLKLATARGDPESWTIKTHSVGLVLRGDTWGPMCSHADLRQNSMEESDMSRLSFRAYTREAQMLRISKRRIWIRSGVILPFSPNAPMRESLPLIPLILSSSTCKFQNCTY